MTKHQYIVQHVFKENEYYPISNKGWWRVHDLLGWEGGNAYGINCRSIWLISAKRQDQASNLVNSMSVYLSEDLQPRKTLKVAI